MTCNAILLLYWKECGYVDVNYVWEVKRIANECQRTECISIHTRCNKSKINTAYQHTDKSAAEKKSIFL